MSRTTERAFPCSRRRATRSSSWRTCAPNANSPYMLYGVLPVHRYSPKYDFFGIGPDSHEETRPDFRLQDSLYEGVAGYRVLPRLTLAGRAGYSDSSSARARTTSCPTSTDGVLRPPGARPRAEPPDFLRYGAVGDLRLARRAGQPAPRRGAGRGLAALRPAGAGARASFDRLAGRRAPLPHPGPPAAGARPARLLARRTTRPSRRPRAVLPAVATSAAATRCGPSTASASAARGWRSARPSIAGRPRPPSSSPRSWIPGPWPRRATTTSAASSTDGGIGPARQDPRGHAAALRLRLGRRGRSSSSSASARAF